MMLLALACTSGPPTESLPQQGSFSALTYNVAGLPEPLSSSEPEAFTPLISPLLNAYDLVMAQEDFAYHALLEAEAAHPFQSIPKEATEEAVADGLNRFSQFPFDPVERIRWLDCHGVIDHASDCLAEKGYSWATTRLAEGVEVRVVNLHAEASSSPADIAARRANFEQLAVALTDYDGALLLGGDTNLRIARVEDLQTYTTFLEALDLTDACTAVDCGELHHIDRFLYRSGGGVRLDASDWRVADEFVTPEGMPLSDHPAIHVDWTWSLDL